MSDKSYLTAITRKQMSLPARFLLKDNRIQGKVLDYGCGRGKDVEELLLRGFDISGYDPNQSAWQDTGCLTPKYDTILCSYVLNVVNSKDRDSVIKKIKFSLKKKGKAYLTVRRDMDSDYVSSRGTEQYLVKLDLPIIKETSAYCIYELSNA